MLQKAFRWAAGRIQGTKGVNKYDTYMQKNPWARTALGAGDLALAFYGPGLAGKGLQKIGAGLGAGNKVTAAGNFLAGSAPVMGGDPSAPFQILPRGASAMQRLAGQVPGAARAVGRGLAAAGRYAAANPSVTGAVLTSVPSLMQQGQANQLAMDEARRRQQQRQEMMDLLRPMFVQMQRQAGLSNG